MLAVCDGHGVKGHLVSARVHQCFKLILEKFSSTTPKQFDKNHKQIINKIFLQVTQMLEDQTDLDSSLSGCTCVAAFFNADKVYVANIGDSRAVLVQRNSQSLSIRNMNIQHKPQLPSQMLRINRMGGKISQSIYNSYEGILRFYNKVQQGPGLALTRAFGDKLFKSSGLISIPDIVSHNIQPKDLVLILGSDGLFDQLVEHQLLSVVNSNTSQEWAQRLCRKSMFNCRDKGMQSSDDISCVTVELHQPSNK